MTKQQMVNAYDEPVTNDGLVHSIQIEVPEQYLESLIKHIESKFDENVDSYDPESADHESRIPLGFIVSSATSTNGKEWKIVLFRSIDVEKWWNLVLVGKYGMVRRRYGGGHDYRQTEYSLKQIIQADIIIDE